jgi:hypothetical protein
MAAGFGRLKGLQQVSHMIPIPDELYERLVQQAARVGEPVERLIEELLAVSVTGRGASSHAGLDWETASAEEIIEELRAARVERKLDVEL